MSLLLTDLELRELTGFRQKSKQAAWLKRNGIKHRLNAQLQPRVDRMHYQEKMGVKDDDIRATSGPDWSGLHNVIELSPRRKSK